MLSGTVRRKFPLAKDLKGIAVACNIMVYPECGDPVTIQFQNLLRFRDLDKFNFKRQFRCDHTQCVYHTFQSSWSHQCQRFRTVRVSHSQKKSRKSADMIPVIMGKTNHINGLETPAFFFNGHLGTFPAVDHQTAAVVAGHQRGKPSAWQRHHSSAAK